MIKIFEYTNHSLYSNLYYFNSILKNNLFFFWSYYKRFNNTALICASYNGHIEVVKELLSHKDIDINIKDILIL